MHNLNINFLYSLFLHSIIIFFLLNLNLIFKEKRLKYSPVKISISTISNFKNELSKKNPKKVTTEIIKKEELLSKKSNFINENKKIIKQDLNEKNKEEAEEVLKKSIEEIPSNTVIENSSEVKNSDLKKKQNVEVQENEIEQGVVRDIKSNDENDTEILEIDNNKFENEEFNYYKSKLRYLIQTEAMRNYPRRSLRKEEEGFVELIFSLKEDGSLENITIGKNTKASENLINSSLKTIKKLSPFEKNDILKKRNKFIIKILYKLN